MQYEDDKEGFGYQLFNGSTIAINKSYHPCVVAPGYECIIHNFSWPKPKIFSSIFPKNSCLSDRDN